MDKPTFILSDESINKSGYRILTSGIDLKEFKKNPVMFYNHQRSNEWSQPELLPIGKWVNIRKKDGQLLADAQFDMEDEFAKKIAKKVEGGYLSAASVGIRIKEISSHPNHLVKGQTRSTVTRSVIGEASVVDIPRNGNCIKLSYQGATLELGGEENNEKLNQILPFIKSKAKKMKTVLHTLGLKEEATEAEALAAITLLRNEKQHLETTTEALQTKYDALVASQEGDKCAALVDKAIADKKITADSRDNWLGLATSNYDNTADVLSKMKGFTSLKDTVESSDSDTSLLSDADKFQTKWEADELLAWKKNNPEEFERCEAAYYETTQ